MVGGNAEHTRQVVYVAVSVGRYGLCVWLGVVVACFLLGFMAFVLGLSSLHFRHCKLGLFHFTQRLCKVLNPDHEVTCFSCRDMGLVYVHNHVSIFLTIAGLLLGLQGGAALLVCVL